MYFNSTLVVVQYADYPTTIDATACNVNVFRLHACLGLPAIICGMTVAGDIKNYKTAD